MLTTGKQTKRPPHQRSRDNSMSAISSWIGTISHLASFKSSKLHLPNPAGSTNKFKPDNLYTLVIGINNYPDPDNQGWHSLKGAIADAESFKGFLIDTLKVPKQHVWFMPDGHRHDIVSTLESLKGGKHLLNSGQMTLSPGSRLDISHMTERSGLQVSGVPHLSKALRIMKRGHDIFHTSSEGFNMVFLIRPLNWRHMASVPR